MRKMRFNPTAGEMEPAYTIKEILRDNWDAFAASMTANQKTIRPVVYDEVQKIIDCQNPEKGYAQYLCTRCDTIKYVPFTCNSRFCNTCGTKYSADRAHRIATKLTKGEHRHVVFTIAEELRPYFAYDRSLLHLLFQAVSDTLFFGLAKSIKPNALPPASFAYCTPSAVI
jgi:hypothetical protein